MRARNFPGPDNTNNDTFDFNIANDGTDYTGRIILRTGHAATGGIFCDNNWTIFKGVKLGRANFIATESA